MAVKNSFIFVANRPEMYQPTAQPLDMRIIRTDIGPGLRQFAEELNDFGPQLAAILNPLQPTRLNRGVIPQADTQTPKPSPVSKPSLRSLEHWRAPLTEIDVMRQDFAASFPL
jgi:hypothetical protein